jgi:hypothetical protein
MKLGLSLVGLRPRWYADVARLAESNGFAPAIRRAGRLGDTRTSTLDDVLGWLDGFTREVADRWRM